MQELPLVAIIGRPNVGKSSLLNRIVGRRQAIIDDVAGTTRDRVKAQASWRGFDFQLVDTAGMDKATSQIDDDIESQIKNIAAQANVIVVVVEAPGIITSQDEQAAKLALKTSKPVILAVNKADAAAKDSGESYEKLGIKTIVKTSAIWGSGTGDLLDAIVAHLPKTKAIEVKPPIRLAIWGRPNVGKSSLFNRIVGREEALISDQAGTTRDINRHEVEQDGHRFELIDTGGQRRPGKIERGVEKYAQARALGSLDEADVAVLIIDATEPAVAVDQRLAGRVAEAGKGLIIAVNKWDLVESTDENRAWFERRIAKQFQFAWWAPLIFISAKTGLNTNQLLELAAQIYQRRQLQIDTPALNHIIRADITPAGPRVKINYAAQTGINPPRFTIFANFPKLVHFSYRRHLENELREKYDLVGTPIKIEFRSKWKQKPSTL